MKLWTSHHTFDHPWETVVKAACRKYPNPLNPSVRGTDVIDRRIKNGILYSHRLITTHWTFPSGLFRVFTRDRLCYASEWSTINPESKEMVIKTVNITLGAHVSVDEVVTYSPHPENSDATLLTQQAVISVQGVPLIDHLEGLLTKTIEENAKKGRLAMEWVIAKTTEKTPDNKLYQAFLQFDD